MASSAEIEREVEGRRAHVETTLDALKRKMSIGQMMDEVGGYVGADEAKMALRNVGRQVRDNPIALGLVGAGLAWLMLGSGSQPRRGAYDADLDDRSYAPDPLDRPGMADRGPRYGSAYGTPYTERADEGPGMLSRAGEAVSGAVHAAGDTLSDAGDRVAHAASRAGDRVRSVGDDGRRRMRSMSEETRSHLPSGSGMSATISDAIERQPLMAGAFAIAAGVAIGVALPATRTEDRLIGDQRDDMRDAARGAARDLGEQAVQAAKAGMNAASDAARDEGLMPESGGKTVAEKVETVVRAGVEETRRELKPDTATPGTTKSTTPV